MVFNDVDGGPLAPGMLREDVDAEYKKFTAVAHS